MTGGADLLSFLANFRPDGYTTFVSIVPDGPTSAATFNGGDPEATARWISRANRRGENVYFTANPTPPDTRRKPTKEGIAAVGAMWADLDPRDDGGHSWADERTRLHALSDELQGRRHPPTLTIDSGNGLQPIWLLEDAIEATPEYRGAADALCARIEAALGAKGTHNVDRLLRVPGTDNFPNRKKLGLGRGKTSSRLLHATWQRYSWRDLEDLAADLEDEPPLHAVPTSPEHRGNAAAGAAGASGGGPRSGLDPEELEELRRSLTGENASGWLTAMLRVIGRLVRDGASDWFIKDWALQYRWPEYTEEQTLREIEPMIAGARRKHFDVGFTEDELALEFTRRHRHELRYVAAWSAWMR